MRCAIKENEVMTLHRFYKCLKDDFRKEVRLIMLSLLTKLIL